MNSSDLLDRIVQLESRLQNVEDHLGLSGEDWQPSNDVDPSVTTTKDLVLLINAEDLTLSSDKRLSISSGRIRAPSKGIFAVGGEQTENDQITGFLDALHWHHWGDIGAKNLSVVLGKGNRLSLASQAIGPMPANHQFEYLPLVLREHGPARFPQAPQPENPTTVANKTNRPAHAGGLRLRSSHVSAHWQGQQDARAQNGLPPITGIPLLLKIDTSLDLDDLRRQFEFEIVSEQEDGFVIVAAEDVDLALFQQKLTDFVGSVTGSANVAKIHEVREDLTQEERLRLVLTDVLFHEWPTMTDDAIYICDVSIACVGTWEVPNKPKRNPRWKDETWARKENEWSNSRLDAYEKWDTLKAQRLQTVREILDFHQAEILMDVDDLGAGALTLPDSFTLRLRISGQGLKDLVLNYPYVFEVAEPDDIETPQQIARDLNTAQAHLNILPPDAGAPAVCVIDSGIQEEHFWLEPGIDKTSSFCFLPGV